MQGWAQFYGVLAAVAATLLGLLFVSVSVNAASSLGKSRDTARRLSEQALQNYLATLLVALVALLPSISTNSLGLVTLCLTGLGGVFTLVRLLRLVARAPAGRRHVTVRRYGASLLGFGMLIFSSVEMILGDDHHQNLFAASLIILLSSATMASWELLLTIARREISEAPGSDPPD